jgi:hypothetical protein
VCPKGCRPGNHRLPSCPAAQRAEPWPSTRAPRWTTWLVPNGANGTTANNNAATATSPSNAGYSLTSRRRTNESQKVRTVLPTAVRQSMVVMMNPLSTKKTSTPMDPPWKSGKCHDNQCRARTATMATARRPSR